MNYSNLYNNFDRMIMKSAEDSKNRSHNRIQEIIAFAKAACIHRIGIANCATFTKEANALEEMLQNEGFEVAKVNCKHGRVPFNELLEGYEGTSCNPAGQAKYLSDAGTELNIMMGLCLGHDMIFSAKSEAPVTNLIVKERAGSVIETLNDQK
ncbi:MAG: DUF1847 domain-containing protein [Prolixibacteraceae bacterium]|nr:DUF1847 domain-containing protein [Prolixibacteraceae bacterium]